MLVVDHKGLNTFPSPYLAAPGCMVEATNVVIDRPGVISPRRGFENLAASYPGVGVKAITTFADGIYLVDGFGVLRTYRFGAWSAYSGFATAYDPAPRFITAGGRLFFTTVSGVRCSRPGEPSGASPHTAFDRAGVPQPPDPRISLPTGSGSGWLPASSSVAYRITFSSEMNGELIEGPPSTRMVVTNTTGALVDTATLWVRLPASATALPGLYVNVYRTATVAAGGADPGDELYLAQAVPYTGSVGANGHMQINDRADVDELGEALYTNATEEGIEGAAYAPPVATELAQFRDYLLYADPTTAHSLDLQLISVVNLDNATFSIGPTAGDRQSFVEGTDFTVVTTGGSNAVNLRQTAQALVDAINYRNYGETGADPAPGRFAAFYTSGPYDPPGRIRILAMAAPATAFTAVSTRPIGNAWLPAIPATHPATTTGDEWSTAEHVKNRIYISKYQQPQAVPLESWIDVGTRDKAIRRMVALRDTLYVFKDDGLYKITGDAANTFRVDLVDESVRLCGDLTPGVMDGVLYAFTLKGLVTISESGVSRPVSMGVARELDAYLADAELLATIKYSAFAIPYERDRKYILVLPAAEGGLEETRTYVYHPLTNAWTRWLLSVSAGVYDPASDRLVAGVGGNPVRERKGFTLADYQDAASEAIPVSIEWTPVMGEAKAAPKQFADLSLLALDTAVTSFTVTTSTDQNPTPVSWTVTTPVTAKTGPIRMLVPREHQRGSYLTVKFTHSAAQEKFQIAGFDINVRTVDERRSGR